jgi:hypothetical protein
MVIAVVYKRLERVENLRVIDRFGKLSTSYVWRSRGRMSPVDVILVELLVLKRRCLRGLYPASPALVLAYLFETLLMLLSALRFCITFYHCVGVLWWLKEAIPSSLMALAILHILAIVGVVANLADCKIHHAVEVSLSFCVGET